MFDKKVNNLMASNQFIQEGLKQSSEIRSENGALKYSTSGNDFVDNFASISLFKAPRSFAEISEDMEELWRIDPKNTVKLTLYIRMITRKSQIMNSEEEPVEVLENVQRGQGMRHEGILRMMWLAINHISTFKANLHLFIAAGSWKDIITMMNLDLQYNGWVDKKLDWFFLEDVLRAGLVNQGTTNLVRKYLPTIRTTAKCTTLESQADTLIGRWLARQLFPGIKKFQAYKQYRLLKSSGTAHQWQQLISQQLYDRINFDKIAGRALAILVGSKFLENHNLSKKYAEWIDSKTSVKYTGFVFEIFAPLENRVLNDCEKATINAQFTNLVNTGKEGVNTNSKFLVVRDTSSSMKARAVGCNMSSYSISKSMALYFSEFLTGPFANSFSEFADSCKLHKWEGTTPVDKYLNDRCQAYGSTNFQSVIDLFISIKNIGIEESDFPTGLLCISD